MPNNQRPTTNHRFRSVSLLFVLALLSIATRAQTVGKLRLMVDPGNNFQFVLDHKYRMQQREVELSAGPHHFSFWAPERVVFDTTFTVLQNEMREVFVRLPYSEEYRTYQEEWQRLRKRMWLEVALPSAVTLGTGILAYSAFRNYKNAHDQLQADEEAYRTGSDPAALAGLKGTVIPRHKDEFKDRRGVFLASAGVFAAVAATSAWMIIRYDKRPDPRFFDREKVRFDGLAWMPDRGGRGLLMAGLHINLR
jgi:hypothetical protein